jgi:ABC-type multidrug transport system ATPase subunit
MLIRLKEQGITTLVSTPYMDEAGLCDRVALIQKGRIMKIDPPDKIRREFPGKLWYVKARHKYRLLKDLQNYEGLATVYPFGESVHITACNDDLDVRNLEGYLKRAGHEDVEIAQAPATIEDCFMDLMNH